MFDRCSVRSWMEEPWLDERGRNSSTSTACKQRQEQVSERDLCWITECTSTWYRLKIRAPHLHTLLNWTSHWYSRLHMQHMWQIKGLVKIPFSLIANVSANFILIAFIPEMSTELDQLNPRPRDKWPTLLHPGHYGCLTQLVTHDVVSSVKLDLKNESGKVSFPRIRFGPHLHIHVYFVSIPHFPSPTLLFLLTYIGHV